MSKRKLIRGLGLLGSVVLLLSTLVLLPTSLGGSTTWILTTGTSMEPGIHTGDLVLARAAAQYEVGDVVAYPSESLDGTVVLHRIVDRTDYRFVTQGDNNDWLDPDQPRPADLLGTQWLHVPEGGLMLSVLTSPFFIAAALVLLAAVGAAGHRRRRGALAPVRRAAVTDRRRRPSNRPLVRPEWVWGAALLALGLALLSFTRPTHVEETGPAVESSVAELSYGAPVADRSVYAAGRVTTGDPVFPGLTPVLDVRMEHTVPARDVSGTVRATAVVETSNGWSARLPLTDPTSFSTGRVVHDARLDLRRILNKVARAERSAGTAFGARTVDVIFELRLDEGQATDGQPSAFRPQVRFTLDESQALLQEATVTDGSVRVADEVTGGATSVTNTVDVLRWAVPVTVLRLVSVAVGLVALLLLAGMALGARSHDPRRHFAGRVVEAVSLDTAGRRDVHVSDPTALARVAELHDTVVITAHGEFCVVTDSVVYRWTSHLPGSTRAQSA